MALDVVPYLLRRVPKYGALNLYRVYKGYIRGSPIKGPYEGTNATSLRAPNLKP